MNSSSFALVNEQLSLNDEVVLRLLGADWLAEYGYDQDAAFWRHVVAKGYKPQRIASNDYRWNMVIRPIKVDETLPAISLLPPPLWTAFPKKIIHANCNYVLWVTFPDAVAAWQALRLGYLSLKPSDSDDPSASPDKAGS